MPESDQETARLVQLEDGLTLLGPDGEQLRVELRRTHGRPAVVRAVLGGSGAGATVIDATAGLGADAFALADAGCRVLAIERSPVVWQLLADGLERARADGQLEDAAVRIELLHGDARELLPKLGPVDAVYLDPLFETGSRSAGKRKGMRLLHLLEGEGDQDGAGLLDAAQAAARRRVTVKRQLRAPRLAGRTPSGSIRGRTIRFDLYPGLAGKPEETAAREEETH